VELFATVIALEFGAFVVFVLQEIGLFEELVADAAAHAVSVKIKLNCQNFPLKTVKIHSNLLFSVAPHVPLQLSLGLTNLRTAITSKLPNTVLTLQVLHKNTSTRKFDQALSTADFFFRTREFLVSPELLATGYDFRAFWTLEDLLLPGG
jgi:hypothetical protein